ncbi:hypothetical protein DNK06_19560 [Pseudomonas daroniae]|uniref:DUF1161 domain-containing protein n=1 Tax=Phytopseudomonas daroniae TaxID=2487519 RepID=A0A4Q9QIZ1_9GAMM|nr:MULTISPECIES: DUF1161 domain-containing protein [Pseudomonas]TBU74364.1 hypothetical protein DNK06_19560 [Pseudomonas daroniae]TBU76017.1 hypothetical protein DNK10_08525 [Pseudomonas daroniae]TBU85452.1 hypothetical protein DNK31_03695 [Pseudomonas sp. FRB 228]TBU94300.1 hypothetical protein DNJ99_03695 [Pseudomonas daroniae]
MKGWTAVMLVLGLMGSNAWAAPKSCEELKQEIEVKIQAAGVSSYTLEIVPNEEVEDDSMVIGTCDNGSRKVIYQRNDLTGSRMM